MTRLTSRNPKTTKSVKHFIAVVTLCLTLAACTGSANSSEQDKVRLETGALGLPLIPWEGGPSYWKNFAKANDAGWSDPGFFPIVAWYDSVSSMEEIGFDKAQGINTYIGMPDTLDAKMLDESGVYWIGGRLNDTFTAGTPSWVGYILDDEVDGRFTPKSGREHLQSIKEDVPEGLFSYANFTYMVLENDMKKSDSESYVNNFTDAVSVDKYWYSIPHCSNIPYRDVSLVPISQVSCRSSSSYGKTMDALRLRDASDGKLQPMWQFIENMGGTDNEAAFKNYIQPNQIQGAVMNSIIHEARGILYFNQSLAGPCKGSNVFRLAQVLPNFCGAEQVKAIKKVNSQVHKLAPVINTQSLLFQFGDGIDSMLKVDDDYAYIFAMIDADTEPGKRIFTLPNGISGKKAEVLFESRTLKIDAGLNFSDDFNDEFTYHIYKVKI